MLAKLRRAPRRCLRHAVNSDRAADSSRQVSAAAFDRNNDVVCESLGIRSYFGRRPDDSIGYPSAFENVVPVCQCFRGENSVENGRKLR